MTQNERAKRALDLAIAIPDRVFKTQDITLHFQVGAVADFYREAVTDRSD